MRFPAVASTQKLGKMLNVRGSRLLLPFLIILCAKLVGAVLMYNVLNMGSSATYWMTVNWDTEGQNNILITGVAQGIKWPYLFLGWDSAWYLSILKIGYAFSTQSYAFFPGLPFFGWLLNLVLQNPYYSIVIFSFVLGIAWVPVYRLVAETYLDKPAILKSTLFYAFFPYVFLFTTVVYAEGLFLFSTLGAWYFIRKTKLLPAMILAAVAVISRPAGLLIILLILMEMLRPRFTSAGWFSRLRNVSYLVIPCISLSAWIIYCKITINDWFAFATRTAWSGMYSFTHLVLNILPQGGINAAYEQLFTNYQNWPFSIAWVLFLCGTPVLIYATFKFDKTLAIYSLVYFLLVLIGGGLGSIPRFISFLFPIWLLPFSNLFKGKHSAAMVFIICAVFYAMGLLLWYSFLNGEFIA